MYRDGHPHEHDRPPWKLMHRAPSAAYLPRRRKKKQHVERTTPRQIVGTPDVILASTLASILVRHR